MVLLSFQIMSLEQLSALLKAIGIPGISAQMTHLIEIAKTKYGNEISLEDFLLETEKYIDLAKFETQGNISIPYDQEYNADGS